VSNRDTIGFTQENVAAQMSELEERMFRLSEALRNLEPENASRLKLALNFSREELILLQMKETQKLLRDAEPNKAETEVRELLAKLEHLRNLLLAEDLDFQLKLARLRQMRETLGQLERIIKEERRELAWSRGAVAERGTRERLRGRRPDSRRWCATRSRSSATSGRRPRGIVSRRPRGSATLRGPARRRRGRRRRGSPATPNSRTRSLPICNRPIPIWEMP